MAQVNIEKQIGGIIVHLKGKFIGGDETEELRNTLKELSDQEVDAAIIDLEKVTYLNSTALGVLISAHASFAKRNAKIILANVAKSIENLFVITKLTLVFPIHETLEEAIKSLH
jgi:anti-anti-sigma factor